MKYARTISAALAAAGALAAALIYLSPKEEVSAMAAPDCDLQRQACTARLPDGSTLELSLSPRPLDPARPFRAEVRLNGLAARKVEIDFAGESMNMGFNRASLAASAPDIHAGEAALSVCVSGGMTWIATVLVETRRQRIAAPFRVRIGT